jgi:hypothetical protein
VIDGNGEESVDECRENTAEKAAQQFGVTDAVPAARRCADP